MLVHTSLQALPIFNNAVITIGSFDGLHLGHKKIIEKIIGEAKSINGESVIITFHPHPRKIISSVPGDIKLLNTLDEKIALLRNAGINHLVVVPFNQEFANLSADDYIRNFLYKYFHPKIIVIGYDHRFGKGRTGNFQLLEKWATGLNFSVKQIDEQLLNEVAISSTQIRTAINNKQINIANALLGYSYFFSGLVIKGNQLGRTIGFPTANLHIAEEEKLIPSNGVYGVHVKIANSTFEGKTLKGMMNIGLRPTVDGKKRMIEVHIFDFDADIYGEIVEVAVTHFIRDEQKFDGLNSLKNQLANDKFKTIELLC